MRIPMGSMSKRRGLIDSFGRFVGPLCLMFQQSKHGVLGMVSCAHAVVS